ncbi:MAG: DUF6868 family protein [Planctomycetota bacterium]|jgi:hypothetical protein
MGIKVIRDVLMWCTIINSGVLLFWFVLFALARDWMHRYHGRWFPMSKEAFNVVHYSGMGLFKLAVVLFNLVPFIALLIVSR